jgi:hypothetical protein
VGTVNIDRIKSLSSLTDAFRCFFTLGAVDFGTLNIDRINFPSPALLGGLGISIHGCLRIYVLNPSIHGILARFGIFKPIIHQRRKKKIFRQKEVGASLERLGAGLV